MKKILFITFILSFLIAIPRIAFSQTAEDTIFTKTEIAPAYSGGQDALIKFLMMNLQYPEKAKEANIQGTVYISFVVEKDGKISNIKVIRGIGGGCDEEAIRVVSKMSKWNPGKNEGKNVRCSFVMPIKFILGE